MRRYAEEEEVRGKEVNSAHCPSDRQPRGQWRTADKRTGEEMQRRGRRSSQKYENHSGRSLGRLLGRGGLSGAVRAYRKQQYPFHFNLHPLRTFVMEKIGVSSSFMETTDLFRLPSPVVPTSPLPLPHPFPNSRPASCSAKL